MSVASELVTRGGRRFVRGVLEVCGVGVTDSGEYSCVASGGGETATATFNLCPVGELNKLYNYYFMLYVFLQRLLVFSLHHPMLP